LHLQGLDFCLDILETQNDHVTLCAPSKFIRDYVSKNLMNLPIQQALESVLGYELRFVLVNTGSNLESKPEAPQGEAQPISISEDSSQVPALSEQNAAVSPLTQPQIQNLTAPPLDINKGLFPPLRNPFLEVLIHP
jgi:chromosomal replication initiation ATPase DnaA